MNQEKISLHNSLRDLVNQMPKEMRDQILPAIYKIQKARAMKSQSEQPQAHIVNPLGKKVTKEEIEIKILKASLEAMEKEFEIEKEHSAKLTEAVLAFSKRENSTEDLIIRAQFQAFHAGWNSFSPLGSMLEEFKKWMNSTLSDK